jgi:hypothetical protein
MRKIDAILLSALMLYDYGAQTLVDSDIISIGSSLITESSSFRENRLALTGSPDSESSYDYTVAENIAESSVSYTGEATVKQIRYHDLARMNPATATVSQQLQENESDNIVISIPDALVEEAVMAPEGVVEAAVEKHSTAFALATVSASSVSVSNLDNIEVKSEIDGANLQFADSDNDGMFNFEDKCPGVAGVARFEGCPVPDSDGDGINDEEDRCPFVQGDHASGGCPAEAPVENSLNADNFPNSVQDAAVQLTEMQFEINDGNILSNRDFNIILQLADKTINNTRAKIDVFKPASNNGADQAAMVIKYLRDLGVKDTQINISAKSAGTNVNEISTGVGIQIRY